MEQRDTPTPFADSMFDGMLISDPQYHDLVEMHYQKYPVLHLDFKVKLIFVHD